MSIPCWPRPRQEKAKVKRSIAVPQPKKLKRCRVINKKLRALTKLRSTQRISFPKKS